MPLETNVMTGVRSLVLPAKVHQKPKFSKKAMKAKRVERERAATLAADEAKKAAAAKKVEKEAAAKAAASAAAAQAEADAAHATEAATAE